MDNGRERTGKELANDPTVVACVVFQTRDPEHLVQLLRQALTGMSGQPLEMPQSAPTMSVQRERDDPWLKHGEAAEYLGVSKSTLYQYACQRKIEFRKLAGRLEYRRSTLDHFKELQIRSAHRLFSHRGIIPSALGSGK